MKTANRVTKLINDQNREIDRLKQNVKELQIIIEKYKLALVILEDIA